MGISQWFHEVAENTNNRSASFTVKHAVHTFYLGGLRRLHPFFPDGEDYWSRDWDVLLILDACRPDLMREACVQTSFDWLPKPDELETVRSPGGTSTEWMDAHFSSNHYADMRRTAYVTANLFVEQYDTRQFGELCQVTEETEGELNTIHPNEVTDRAIDIWRRRQELDIDRMVVHYMQPHTPFRSRPDLFRNKELVTGWGRGFLRLRDGKIDKEAFWDAYLDNLIWVLESVDCLLSNCDADIAITSDHGNGLGEWGVYGHPNGIPLSSVREVPWISVKGTDLETHTPKLPERYLRDPADVDEKEVAAQLEALGYA